MADQKTKAKPAAKAKDRAKGITSGRLLTLYNEAVARGTAHNAFTAHLVQAGGYKNRSAAQARLNRLKRELAGRGLSLVPLKGARLGRNNRALQTSYAACLVGE